MAKKVDEISLTLSEMARLAAVPETTIVNWRTRGHIDLEADVDREGRKWRRYTIFDVLRMAVTGELVNCCVPISRAWDISEEMIIARTRHLASFKNTPIKAVVAKFLTQIAIITKDDRGEYQSELMPRRLYDINQLSQRPSHIFIDLGYIAESALGLLDL